VNVVSTFAAKAIICRQTIISGSGIESVRTLRDLESVVSLSETEASLRGQDETDLGVEVSNVQFAVHGGDQGLLGVNICEVERKRGCCVVLEADLLQT
jgi:hypothetical protein